MAQFPGMNEKAFQKIAMAEGQSLTGSDVSTFTTETTWNCSDGSTQHHYRNTIRTTPMTFTEIYNGSADKVTGWTLTGKGASVFTENNTGGTRFPSYTCPRATRTFLDPRVDPYRVADRVVHLQRHQRQHRGHPVRGPHRLIQPRTKEPTRTTAAPPGSRSRGR